MKNDYKGGYMNPQETMHYPERSFHPQEFIQKINISDMLLYNNEVGKVFPAEKKEQSLPSS